MKMRVGRGAVSAALTAAVALPGLALASGHVGSVRSARSSAHAAAGGCHVTRSRSGPAKSSTSITFVNSHHSTVGVYWLNYTGYLQFYETIAAGRSFVQRTYKASAWVMLNRSFSCVGYVVPSGQAKYVIH